MITFKIDIEWCDTITVINTVIDSVNIPTDSPKQTIINVYNNFLDKIQGNLNTPRKCLSFMQRHHKGPFKHNHIDRAYHIIAINIITNLEDEKILKRKNGNFIYKFSKYFEILRDDHNNYTWRFTEY